MDDITHDNTLFLHDSDTNSDLSCNVLDNSADDSCSELSSDGRFDFY